MSEKESYYVYTWDTDTQAFSPQKGVRCGPHSLWGLKRALQKLKTLGYSCTRDDPSVLVSKGKEEYLAR